LVVAEYTPPPKTSPLTDPVTVTVLSEGPDGISALLEGYDGCEPGGLPPPSHVMSSAKAELVWNRNRHSRQKISAAGFSLSVVSLRLCLIIIIFPFRIYNEKNFRRRALA
jgi:hypothetical protein